MEIVGKSVVNYTSRKTNQPVYGINLHLLGLSGADPNVEGCRVDSVFISSRLPCFTYVKDFPLGSVVNIYYNKFGGVEDVIISQN